MGWFDKKFQNLEGDLTTCWNKPVFVNDQHGSLKDLPKIDGSHSIQFTLIMLTLGTFLHLRSLHPGTGNRWRTLAIPSLVPGLHLGEKGGLCGLERPPRCR